MESEFLNNLSMNNSNSMWPFIIIGIIATIGLIIFTAVYYTIHHFSHKETSPIMLNFFEKTYKPAAIIFIIFLNRITLPFINIDTDLRQSINHVLYLLMVAAIAYFAINIVTATKNVIIRKYEEANKDDLKKRTALTQIQLIDRIAIILILLIAISVGLLTFEKIRQVGISVLASAGILGIIIGIAAQKSLAALLSGIQIAITQPIRIDDEVIINGEWGQIEEITLTYVVVILWDERRLIVPINYFMEQSFQNWTRISKQITGTVYLYVDYTAPIQKLRETFEQFLLNSECWDKRFSSFYVTNTSENTLELRMTMSAANSTDYWKLRCTIREKIVHYLQEHYPQCLPKTRLEWSQKDQEN